MSYILGSDATPIKGWVTVQQNAFYSQTSKWMWNPNYLLNQSLDQMSVFTALLAPQKQKTKNTLWY